jgi:hypothetical protein
MGVGCQIHVPAYLPPGKNPGAYCMTGWMDPIASMSVLEKRKFPFPLLAFEPTSIV